MGVAVNDLVGWFWFRLAVDIICCDVWTDDVLILKSQMSWYYVLVKVSFSSSSLYAQTAS